MSNSQNDVVEQNLLRIIADAPNHILEIVREKENGFDQLEKGPKHRRLSKAWVKYLSLGLEKFYREDLELLDVYAFPGNPKLKKKHGIKRNEFLFDISVGKYDHFNSKVHKKNIYYQSEPIWQIESEFAYNMVELAIDFSKLIAGNAPYKMMVGSLGKSDSKNYLQDMKQLAEKVQGALYFLFIPRPNKWLDDREKAKDKPNKWYLHRWNIDRWEELKNGNWELKK